MSEPFRSWSTDNILAPNIHGVSGPDDFEMPYALKELAEGDESFSYDLADALNSAYACGLAEGKKLPKGRQLIASELAAETIALLDAIPQVKMPSRGD
jgi:hypothetical protein